MSRTDINDLVAVCAGVFGLALYAGLILVPAWTRLHAPVGAPGGDACCRCTCSRVLVGIGVAGALAIVYFWG